MKKETTTHTIDGIFVLLLFAVFAGCILIVLLFGARAYERVVSDDQKLYDERTGVQYIAAKLRHSDNQGLVSVGSFSDRTDPEADDMDTLYLQYLGDDGEVVSGFFTKIYYYDGYIREVLSEEDAGLNPEDGNEILAAQGLSVEQDGALVSFTVTNTDGSESGLSIALRSGGRENG